MNSSVIIMESVTEANKAKRQLLSHGFNVSVEKVSGRRGDCSYAIRVFGSEPNKICRLLSTINVRCGEIIQKRGQR